MADRRQQLILIRGSTSRSRLENRTRPSFLLPLTLDERDLGSLVVELSLAYETAGDISSGGSSLSYRDGML